MNHLELWTQVEKTPPYYTKSFSRSGGFKGTAVSPMYLIRKATELWGPLGGAWGVDVLDEKILDGAPLLNSREEVVGHEKIHEIRISLRHPGGTVPAVGQTVFVGKNKYGAFTDEEAPKKSLTDALSKALSWLGFSADIHMGRYDDNKYVNDLKREFSEAKPEPVTAPRVTATAGAGDGLSDERKEAIQETAAYMVDCHKAGKDMDAIRVWYAADTFKDNDERVYCWSLLGTESKLRSTIKANKPEERKAA